MRCNTLVRAEKEQWNRPFQIAQRPDARYFCRFKIPEIKDGHLKEEIYHDVSNQKLPICQNCFMKVNSLLDGGQVKSKESFLPRNFFDVDFFGSWCRYGDNYEASESLANMYPKDWQNISRIRKVQVQHLCEACNTDFSVNQVKKFLHVYPIDYVKKKRSYVKLQSICLSCLSEYPERSHFKNHPDFQRCLEYIATGTKKKEPSLDDEFVVRRRYD
jgi:hypothetical protein